MPNIEHCSFCGISSEKTKLIIQSEFNKNVKICDSCIEISHQILQESQESKRDNKICDEKIQPKNIKSYMDKYVIGQENAKKILSVAIYNHMLKIRYNLKNVEKSNVLLIGPSGTGKTYLANIMAKFLNIPFSVADATTLTETGYVGCFNCDTEYLSEYGGWRKIKDYEREKIAQYNPKTKQAEFVYPLYYYVLPCDKLTKFKTRYKGLSQILSDEHNVFYITSKKNLMKRKFSEIRRMHDESKFGFNGKFITTFNPPDMNGLDFNEWELRLQVAAIADGSFPRKSRNKNYCIFAFRKQRKVERLLWILKSGNISYAISGVTNGYTKITCTTKIDDKEFDEKYFKLNKNQLYIISDECVFWDGNQVNQFYTSSEKSADFIQYCFSVTGWRSSISRYTRKNRPNISPEFRVHRTKSIYPTMCNKDGKIHMEEYPTRDGYKYCFTTLSGMLIARNDKHIFITGNSDPETIFQPLIFKYKPEEISKGAILVLDEMDKKARKSGPNVSITRDVSGESVMYSLLKMVEGHTIDIPLTGMRKHPHGDRVTIDTSNTLFVFAGAFNGLSDIISQRLGKNEIGFNQKEKTSKSQRDYSLLKFVEHEDLIQFGLIPELVGRIPIIAVLDELTLNDLSRILIEPENALMKQYTELLAQDQIELKIDSDAIEEIVKLAMEKKLGARGLRSIMEKIMLEFMFSVDRNNPNSHIITKKLIGGMKYE